jgi:hypothetical protein
LIETFKKYAIPVPGGKDVTRSVWFDIKQIHRIDSLLKDEESKGMKTDGIRIYFGTYPQKDLHGKAYDYPFQNTVIFVSTKDSIADNQHYHQNYYDHPEVHPMVPENRGELCEPNCKGNNGL